MMYYQVIKSIYMDMTFKNQYTMSARYWQNRINEYVKFIYREQASVKARSDQKYI